MPSPFILELEPISSNNISTHKSNTQPSRSWPAIILKATKKTQSVAEGNLFWLEHTLPAISKPEILRRRLSVLCTKWLPWRSVTGTSIWHSWSHRNPGVAPDGRKAVPALPCTCTTKHYSGIMNSGADSAAPACDPSQLVGSFSHLNPMGKTQMSPRMNILSHSFLGWHTIFKECHELDWF